jgi:hypothetical protein
MKGLKYIIISLILLAGFSCKKDTPVTVQPTNPPPPPPPSVTVYDYLVNYSNSIFVSDYMPKQLVVNSACPVINDVNGNAYAKPGGTNQLKICFTNPNHNVNKLYYGIKGVYGYFEAEIPQNYPDTVYMVVVISQAIEQNNFTIELNMADSIGNISAPYYIPVELVSDEPGKLQVTLSFDQANDLDLHLFEPNGYEIYFHQPVDSCTGGYLVDDANANCNADTFHNIEEILFPDSVPLGTYKVRVAYYKQCIDSVNTIFSATALYNGQVIQPLPGQQWQNPCLWEFSSGAAGYTVDCMEFNINAHSRLVHIRFKNERHHHHRITRVIDFRK